jgi:diguanylate cyclase (GGDEF)-like protein
MTDCPTIRDRLAAFAAKELTRKAREKVEDHLAECPSCAAALEALKAGVPGPVQHAERQWKSVWDDLTGLLTSKTFVDRLNEEVERARRYGRTLGLVYLDIDFFKRLNDTYGLMAGDRVLVSLAHLIGAHSRAGDVPCRYGGEHFVLLLPETSVDGPRIVAERLRQATEEMAVPSDDGPPISLSVSAGIAVYPYEGGTAEELLERADQALRRAKMEGRNRVVQLPRRGDHKADPEAPAFAREKRVIGFGDLSHFFVGASQRDNLAVAAALQEFYEQMDQRVEGHGGRVVKFIGDALLFCFPAGCERDAVACSREMVEAVRSGLAEEWGLSQMVLGIGLNSGEVVAGEFGPAGRRTFDVFGDSVNVASLIGRGEGIKITEAVRRALGENVQVEAVEPLRRGEREIALYRVV